MTDLTAFTDKELIALEKKIKEEKEKRQGGLLYKSNIHPSEAQYKDMTEYFTKILKDHGVNVKQYEYLVYEPIHAINKGILPICDYIFGNFEKVHDKNGREKIQRNGSRLLIDDKEDYNDMYQEMLAVIDKWIIYKGKGGSKC